jgi:hypothetical protein
LNATGFSSIESNRRSKEAVDIRQDGGLFRDSRCQQASARALEAATSPL